MEPWLQIMLAILLLLVVPAACALVLRKAAAPGAAVLGGILAGMLLGPTILGRAWPLLHEELFIGGIEQREALESLISRQGADLLAAEAAGFDRQAIEDLRREHAAQRDPVEQQWRNAQWQHQRPLRVFTGVIVAIALAGAGLFSIAKPRDSHPGVARNTQTSLTATISATSIGLWSAALPGTLAFIAANRWWGWDAAESALVAAAVMIGPWALTQVDRDAADQAEIGGARTIQNAGRVATLIALGVAAWALYTTGWRGVLWLLPLLAIVIGWMIRANPRMSEDERRFDQSRDREGALLANQTHATIECPKRDLTVAALFRVFLDYLVVPALAALAAIRIELIAHFAIWPIIILLLLSGDGRWLGSLIGALLLGGRSGLRTMRLVLGSMACGPTQLAVITLAAHLWLIPGQAVMALVIGAVVIEISAPLRRSMARQLTETEEWEL